MKKLIVIFLLIPCFALAELSDESLGIYEDLVETGINPLLAATSVIWREQNLDKIEQKDFMVIVDMKLHSSKKRFYLYNTNTRHLETFHVTHGINSEIEGPGLKDGNADEFSNIVGSLQTSLGAYTTDWTYDSSKFNSRALKLDGHSVGINDNARRRYILVHQADYASAEMADIHGKLGWSEGCLAMDPDFAQAVIDDIMEGRYIFVGYGASYNMYLTPEQIFYYEREFKELNLI